MGVAIERYKTWIHDSVLFVVGIYAVTNPEGEGLLPDGFEDCKDITEIAERICFNTIGNRKIVGPETTRAITLATVEFLHQVVSLNSEESA